MSVVQLKAAGVLGSTDIHESFASNVGAGNTLVVFWCSPQAVGGGTAVTDSVGTVYSQVEFVNDTTKGEFGYCYVGIAPTGGANTVTAALGGSPVSDGAMILAELTGRTAVNPVGTRHAQAIQDTPGATISCGAITALGGDDVLMFMCDTGALRTANYTQGAGFTEVAESGDGATILDAMAQKKENVTAGSITGTAGTTNNDHTISVIIGVQAAVSRSTYSTTFAGADENPISESSNWINGAATGVDWGDIRVLSHKAIGTLATTFHDNTAILTGDWQNDQWGRGTIWKGTPNTTFAPEVEIRLRSSITANVNRGYEAGFGLKGGANSYLIMVRWNGAVGSFDYLFNSGNDAAYEVLNGDVMYAQIVGNLFTASATRSGTVLFTKTVDITSIGGTVWPSGAPGMGINFDTGGTVFTEHGLTTFDAGDFSDSNRPGYTAFPKPPQRLRALGSI